MSQKPNADQLREDYINIKTTDNNQVWIRRDQLAAIEEIPGSARTNAYLKLYVAGYSFNFGGTMDELSALILSKGGQ